MALMVDVGNRPVVGVRLQLEGRSNNRLAIHLQRRASLPESLSLSENANAYLSCDSHSCNLHEKLQVEKKRLFLRLRFSKVIGATLQKAPEWDQFSSLGQFSIKSGGILIAFISKGEQRDHPKPGDVTISSTKYRVARPAPVHTPMLLRFVDTTEMIRGPQDNPGYWVVSGARLSVQHGKLYVHVKYSLLSFVMQSETEASQVL
ncbi:MACPF domain-containing protein [Spatholobus suberectus]|nr:MACPF domain-containing protein [Spatholobus suberectus]